MYRSTYSNCYTKGVRPVVGGIERLRVKDKTLRQNATRQPIARGEVSGETATLGKGEETRSRKELGKLFNVSHEAIRIWEENGKLLELGWERVEHSFSPVRYRQINTSQPIDPNSPTSALG